MLKGEDMRLLEYIKKKGDSLNNLSWTLDIPYARLDDGLRRPANMKFEDIQKLSRYYGISIDYLASMMMDTDLKLLKLYRDQQDQDKLGKNLYHFTQISFAYNSNAIDGNSLTEEQVTSLFDKNTPGKLPEDFNIDHLVEVKNTFYMFDEMLRTAETKLSESMLKRFHLILKSGSSDSIKENHVIGEYKLLPNTAGDKKTSPPREVHKAMLRLFDWYNKIKEPNFFDLIDFHYKFLRIHPFQNGNGRIARLVFFKECLKNNIIPVVVDASGRDIYYKGLNMYDMEKEFLINYCKKMLKKSENVLQKFAPEILKKK